MQSCIVLKKNLRILILCQAYIFEVMPLILNFSVSIMLNYGDMTFFPNKFKFDRFNIFTTLFYLEQKIINTCPSDKLISLKS